jgi:xylulose-5-phosphate/fructose-6-phosphate phosphoketolase
MELSSNKLRVMDAYWRACNYLSAGMIYLRANPLLREPLKAQHLKRRLLGHWGTDPGQSFTWVHLNRLIRSSGARQSFEFRKCVRNWINERICNVAN